MVRERKEKQEIMNSKFIKNLKTNK